MKGATWAFILVLSLSCAMRAYALEQKPILSILDLRISGVSKSDADVLIDFLSSHLLESGEYTLVDRSQREAVLKEIEFSQSDCTDEACQLQIGKLLSANQIVVGSIGKLEQTYLLNLQIVDVETGRLLKAVSGQYESMEEMIANARSLVRSLIETEESAARQAITAKKEQPEVEKQPPTPERQPSAPATAAPAVQARARTVPRDSASAIRRTFTLNVKGNLNAQLSAVDGYGAKTQLGGEAAVDVLFPVTGWLGLGVSAGWLGAMPSEMNGGFGYRAYSGGFLGFTAEASAPLATWTKAGTLRGGGRLGVIAGVAGYGGTGLVFFFPSLGLDGFLRFTPAALPFLDIGVTLPLRVYFRKDLQFSGSAGLGMSIAVSTGRAR
jgi:hypothetical protein